MPDEELTAKERAARAAEAAAEARRAAARHAAARRAEQDAKRRTIPARRPPAVAPKAGLAFRGTAGTTVDPARASQPARPTSVSVPATPAPGPRPPARPTPPVPPEDVAAPETSTTGSSSGSERPQPPAPRKPASPVRTAPVPDDRSGSFSVARLTGAEPAVEEDERAGAGPAAAPAGERPTEPSPAPQPEPTPVSREAEPEPTPEESAPEQATTAQPALEEAAPERPAEQAAPAQAEPAQSPEDQPAQDQPATAQLQEEPAQAAADADAADGRRTGAVTGRPTDLPPLPTPPGADGRDRRSEYDEYAAEAPDEPTATDARADDGLRLPLPPRSPDGERRATVGPATRDDGDARGAVDRSTADIDVSLPVDDERSDTAEAGAPAADDDLRLPEPPRRPDAEGVTGGAGPWEAADGPPPAAYGDDEEPHDEPAGSADATVDLGPAATRTAPDRTEDRGDADASDGEGDGRPWVRSYPPGVPDSYRYPLVPLTRFVDDAAQDFPDTAAISFLGTETTYRQLSEQVDRFATALQEMGLARGDRLAMALPWCPQLVVVLHACWRIGIDVVLLDPDAPADQLADGVAATTPSALVLLDTAYPGLVVHRERLTSVTHVIATGVLDGMPAIRARVQAVRLKLSQPSIPQADGVRAYKDVLEAATPTATQVDFDVESTPAVTVVSDGSAVSLTHHHVLVGAFQARLWLPDVRAGNESLAIAGSPSDPFTIGAGLTMAMLAAATLVLPEPRSGGLARTIDDTRPTLLVAPIDQIRRVLAPASKRRDLTSLRVTLAAGMATDPAVRRTMQQRTDGRMRICLSAPHVAGIALAEPVYAEPRRTSAAIPPPDGAVRIVRADDRGVGEIEVSGPHVTGDWVPLGLVGTLDDTGFVEVVGATDTVIAHADGVTDPEVLVAALRRDAGIVDAAVATDYVDDAVRMYVSVTAIDHGITPQRLTQILAEQAPTQSPPGEWRITQAAPPETAAPETAAPGPAPPGASSAESGPPPPEASHTPPDADRELAATATAEQPLPPLPSPPRAAPDAQGLGT